MNILVVGGYSFIGTNIVNHFIKQDHKVCVIDNLNRHNKKYVVGKHVSFNYSVNSDKCEKPFKRNKFDVVIHLTNIKGFSNISCLCKKYCVDKMIVVNDIDERFFVKSEHIFCITYDNIFGPRQNKENIVSDLIKEVLDFENINVKGNGDEKIKLLYVQDVINVIYNICVGQAIKNKVSLLTGQGCSVNQIIEILRDQHTIPTVINNEILRDQHTIPIEINNKLDYDNNIELDGNDENFKYEYYPLENGIKETYEWYKSIYIKRFNECLSKKQDYTA